jgi:hypothetical protein
VNNSEPDALAALIRTVGRRPAPPADDYERVFAASHIAWRQMLAARRRRHLTWALAASLVIAVCGLSLWSTRTPYAPQAIATLEFSSGLVESFDEKTSRWIARREPTPALTAGTRLRTGDAARLALRLPDGSVLRVQQDTELALNAARRFELARGIVYAHNRGAEHLAIETPLGTVIDVGTQFEVQLNAGTLRARVRSGSVRIERRGDPTVECGAGEQLRLEAGGAPIREKFAADSEYWSWMTPLTQPPTIEGLPLDSFLVWAAEELGRSLQYATPDVEAHVRRVRLHGTIDNLSPLQALDSVLAGTSLSYVLRSDGSMLVTARERPE